MSFFSALKSLFSTPASATPRSRPGARPRLENLEDRLVPAATNPDFVDGVVRALANRAFDATKDQGLVNGLNSGQLRLIDVASLVEMSDDAINFNITSVYNRFLLRDPDAGGRAHFFALFKAGLSIQEAKVQIIASPEYFSLRGGGNNTVFLDAVFADNLGRSVDPIGRAFFTGELNNPAIGTDEARRQLVARQVVNSAEGANKEMRFLYQSLLVRQADPTGAAFFVALLSPIQGVANPTSEQEVRARMVGSQEFFDRG